MSDDKKWKTKPFIEKIEKLLKEQEILGIDLFSLPLDQGQSRNLYGNEGVAS